VREGKVLAKGTLVLLDRGMEESEQDHTVVIAALAATVPPKIIRSPALYLVATAFITTVGRGEEKKVMVVAVVPVSPSAAITCTVKE